MKAKDIFTELLNSRQKVREKTADGFKPPIILGDGAMGTELMKIATRETKIPLQHNLINPAKVSEIHQRYLQAGADIITTNTFCANRLYLQQTEMKEESEAIKRLVKEINQGGAEIARQAVNSFQKNNSRTGPKLTAGSIGPTGSEKAIFPEEGDNKEELIRAFKEQIAALEEGGVDILIFETFSYHLELRAALEAADNFSLPWIINMSFDNYNTTNYGTKPADMAQVVRDFPQEKILAAGINCIAPDRGYQKTIKNLTAELAPLPLSLYYNAGTPELDIDSGKTSYKLEESFYKEMEEAARLKSPAAKILGGCCGTSPAVIKELKTRFNI